jgi:hypothetical protein
MVRRVTPLGSAIYLIYEHSTGLPYYVLSYEIAPRLNNRTYYCWSLRSPGAPPDPYECDWTPSKWAKVLSGEDQGLGYAFDYVWVINADPAFWATYGTLFDENTTHDPGLYRVQKENGRVRLRPVTGQKD